MQVTAVANVRIPITGVSVQKEKKKIPDRDCFTPYDTNMHVHTPAVAKLSRDNLDRAYGITAGTSFTCMKAPSRQHLV